MGFFRKDTNEGICVKKINLWSNTRFQKRTYFTTHYTDVADAKSQFNDFFNNINNSTDLELEVRQCTNLDEAPPGYDPGSSNNAFTFVYGQGK